MKLTPFIPAGALCTLLLAACGGGRVWDSKINATDQDTYGVWYQSTAEHLPNGDEPILKEAEEEIRLDIMGHTQLSGKGAIDAAYLQKVDGLTALQLIELGLNDRITRLSDFRDDAKRLIGTNSQIRGANEASTAILQNTIDQQQDALTKTEDQLASTKADLAKITEQSKAAGS